MGGVHVALVSIAIAKELIFCNAIADAQCERTLKFELCQCLKFTFYTCTSHISLLLKKPERLQVSLKFSRRA